MTFNEFDSWYKLILRSRFIDKINKEDLSKCKKLINDYVASPDAFYIRWSYKYEKLAEDLKDKINLQLVHLQLIDSRQGRIIDAYGYITDDCCRSQKERDYIRTLDACGALERLFTNKDSTCIYKVEGKQKVSNIYTPYKSIIEYTVHSDCEINMADAEIQAAIMYKYPYIENNDEFYIVAKRKDYSLFALMKYINVVKGLGYTEAFARRTFNKRINTINVLKKIAKEELEEETVIFLLKDYMSSNK